jgi:ribosomal peptide maturation radical SAM protein 1
MSEIALISAPWPLFDRPSIQLGTLQAYLQRGLPEVRVKAHPFYLSVAEALGYDVYRRISERTWLCESLFAALLYPERRGRIQRFWQRRSARSAPELKGRFEDLLTSLAEVSRKCLDGRRWDRCLLIGVSICFGQLSSSLYFLREIKRRAPGVQVVAGGSACAGDLGASLLRVFPDLDYVIQGEGELPLLHLASCLKRSDDGTPVAPFPGLISPGEGTREKPVSQVDRLDDLPVPDYGDYFTLLRSLEPGKAFLPRVPMEISRGCWRRGRGSGADASGCAFCNLNLQWEGYRAKSAPRVVEEIRSLSDRHMALSISFMDNLLPPKGLAPMFAEIRALGKDLRLFAEIRAGTPDEVLAAMGAAGMREVQVGIEALSTGLLNKLRKGTTAMENVEIMKNSEAPGRPALTGNLILDFPSSDEKDVSETLRTLDFVFPFRPLKAIPFWLGYGSPVWRAPSDYGIRGARNHPFYRHLFPGRLLDGLTLMIQGYRGGVRLQRRLWRPVGEKVDRWTRSYMGLHRSPHSDPILSYQEGGDFLIIRERRLESHDMTHRLTGASRRIYLFCEAPRSLPRILAEFPKLGEERIRPFLRMMVEKRLMFAEEERYLSLAVPARGH